MDNVEKAAQPVLAKINRALAKPAMTDVELRQDASAEYVKGWNDGIAARKELDDLSAIDPVALVQAEIEKLREALRDIQIEADRERGNWTHLKQVIARKARAALGDTK